MGGVIVGALAAFVPLAFFGALGFMAFVKHKDAQIITSVEDRKAAVLIAQASAPNVIQLAPAPSIYDDTDPRGLPQRRSRRVLSSPLPPVTPAVHAPSRRKDRAEPWRGHLT